MDPGRPADPCCNKALNYPLAGKALKFTLKVTGVRAATGEEIGHRHVHGEHGHQH